MRHDARADRFLTARNTAPGLVTEAGILKYEVDTGEAVRTDPPLFESRDHAGDSSDLLIRNRPLGAALAQCLGAGRVVLMRSHGCTVVAGSVYRAVYTELNARLQLQVSMLGEVQALTPGEADATQATNEGQIERPWNLWRERARAAS